MFASKLNFVFCPLLAVGVILFIFWAVKYLKGPQLKKLSMWLVAIGIVGSVISGGCHKKFGRYHGKNQDHSIMLEALSSRGFEMTQEEYSAMMEEVMAAKKAAWKEKN